MIQILGSPIDLKFHRFNFVSLLPFFKKLYHKSLIYNPPGGVLGCCRAVGGRGLNGIALAVPCIGPSSSEFY